MQFNWIEIMTWSGIVGAKPTTPRRQYIETVRHYFTFCELGSDPGKRRFYKDYQFPELYS